MSHPTHSYGIDLGTCTCYASCVRTKDPDMIGLGGNFVIPSVVAYSKSSNTIKVGVAATSIAKPNEYSIVYDSKRFIGKSYMEIDTEECRLYPFKIIKYANEPVYHLHYNNKKDHLIYPVDVSSEILKSLNSESFKQITHEKIVQDDLQIVIGVPAVFSYDQKEATKKAAEKAGLKNVELIIEPTAAALAYIDSNDNYISKSDCKILIYDFGGGTFDVSIVHKKQNRIEVLGTYGDDHLGGEDITRKLEEYVKAEIKEVLKDSVDVDLPKNIRNIHKECENAKINLSVVNEYEIDFSFKGCDECIITVTREKLNELCKEIFQTTIEVVERTLKICDLKPNDIDYIVLVGGSSKIPAIENFINSYFKDGKIYKNINGVEAVARGAAIYADYLMKGESKYEIIETVSSYSVCYGIDLGTTFSCSAFYDPVLHSTAVIKTNQSTNSIPSIVSFNKTTDEIKAGIKVSNMSKYSIVCDSKRFLGKKRSMVDNNVIKYSEYKLSEDRNGDCVYEVIHNNKTEFYSPTKISSLLLKSIKNDAIKRLPNFENEKEDEFPVVITVPADFSFFERDETKKAAEEAGFKVLQLINEPTAAAYAYIVNNETLKVINSDNYNLLIYDFGGGTFDSTVLNVNGKKITVKSTIGNNNLGGQDITNKLCDYFVNKIQKEKGVKLDIKKIKRVKDECEKVKIELSMTDHTTFDYEDFSEEVSMSFLNELCKSEIMQTIDTMNKAIRMAKVNLDYVVLVGGSSKICCVKSIIAENFPKVNILMNISPDEVVAQGAALYARLRRDDSMKINHIEMVDVLSKSLGYKVTRIFMGKAVIQTILEKCTPLPCRGVSIASSARGKATVDVYEGEGKIEDMRHLGCVNVNIDADSSSVEVEFDVDINGRLTVTAKCNGKSYNCVIQHV